MFSVSDAIAEVEGLATQFEVFRFMRRVGEAYGHPIFLVSVMPPRTVLELTGNTIITNWPSELLQLFDRNRMLQTSPLLMRLRRSTLPWRYTIEDVARERGSTEAREIFERFGIYRGSVFPTHDVTGKRGLVIISGDGPELTDQQMMELTYLSAHVYERLTAICTIDIRVVEPLGDRELECLNWTSAGKTSAEIAEILQLSEHTVNHYLNRATRKLGAVNRTQAVANAFRMGLIE